MSKEKCNQVFSLSQKDIEAAQKSVANVVSTAVEKSHKSYIRAHYNTYSTEQRAMIGKDDVATPLTCTLQAWRIHQIAIGCK